MELADSYDTLGQVPAEHLSLYVEKDGKYVLQLTGLKTQSDFDRYATALKARLADQATDIAAQTQAGMSRDDVIAVIKEVVKPNAGGGQGGDDNGDGGGADSQQLHDMQRQIADLQTKLDTATTEGATAKAEATETKITNALTGAAAKAGVRPEAVDSFVALLRDNFEVSGDGEVVVKLEGNKLAGVTPNAKPDEALAVVKRAKDHAYFWPESQGGGGGGSGGGSGGGGGGADSDNPWSKDGWNLTKQGQAVMANREDAEALAKAAGSSIGAAKPPA